MLVRVDYGSTYVGKIVAALSFRLLTCPSSRQFLAELVYAFQQFLLVLDFPLRRYFDMNHLQQWWTKELSDDRILTANLQRNFRYKLQRQHF